MCCAGCQAVAQAIVANQLTDYYRHRDAMPESPRAALPDVLRDVGLFDHPEFQKGFVRPVGEGEREASLILEGITCAACVWLNEQHIAGQPGVLGVDINYATRRARVRWDETKIRLSEILTAIAAIGYRAYPYDAERSEALAKKERRAALWRLFVAGFGMMQVMMYAIPAYIADAGTMTADIGQLMRWASLILTLPVIFYSAAPFFRSAWRDVKLWRVGMDVPVALGVGSAFVASLWATWTASGEVYFDSVTMFVFFLLGGRYLELMARQRAVRDVEQLAKVLPRFATRLVAYPGHDTERVPAATLASGDVLLVKAGEAFPADGMVLQGSGSADESLLSGESRPVPKAESSEVIGGTINGGSVLIIRATGVGESTKLAAIRQLMERAQAEKPPVVVLADRVAGWFVAVLLILAAGTAVAWYFLVPDRALWVFVSVLVVSCPCALSLATPAALTAATGALSRLGLLPTRGHAIETLAQATHFVFDKTGTLTAGKLQLVETIPLAQISAGAALELAVALEGVSEHAIGASLRGAATAAGLLGGAGMSAAVATGQGIEGAANGETYRIGRIAYVEELTRTPLAAGLAGDQGAETVVALGRDGEWIALFRLRDRLRPSAVQLVQALKSAGRQVCILSGDSPGAVAAVAAELDVAEARSGLSPQDKHEFILGLQRRGAVVAMVGDGVNDAPVLAQAQVSIAMGSGTDLARNQGDMVLLSDDLARLADGLLIARRASRIIRQNLLWAFAYNLVAIPAAMFGWVAPWMAGIGMSASSLMVVLNALRLGRSRSPAVSRGPALDKRAP